MKIRHVLPAIVLAALLLVAAACGTSSGAPSTSGSTPASSGSASTPQSSQPAGGGSSAGPGALVAESKSAAAGDIPDNQVFLWFNGASAGYGIKYPEGWAIRRSGGAVTIQDKNNLVRLVADTGAATVAQARADMNALAAANPGFRATQPLGHPTCINMGTTVKLPLVAVHVVYTTMSKPNPVTGKRALLSVDRYYLSKGGTRVVADLGTPKGVDNVDAYCLMISSFKWR